MKLAVVMLFIMLGVTLAASAQPFQGIVGFNYDYILDAKLDARRHYKIELTGDGDELTGRYVEMDNDSEWKFKFYQSRGSIIMRATQIDGSFYRVMSGEVVGRKIIGTWFAVGGLKGDFEIIQE